MTAVIFNAQNGDAVNLPAALADTSFRTYEMRSGKIRLLTDFVSDPTGLLLLDVSLGQIASYAVLSGSAGNALTIFGDPITIFGEILTLGSA